MMAMWVQLLGSLAFILCLQLTLCQDYDPKKGKECTYFGGNRLSSSQGNLVNCSWYSGNACCKRTEVTSVFGGMYPLYGATQACRDRINYLMCYFCSPEQYKWYNKAAYVCLEFCNAVYEECKTAEYKGKAIGDEYTSGETFCKGQKFKVSMGAQHCFDFDPTVFAAGQRQQPSWITTIISVLYAVLIIICTNAPTCTQRFMHTIDDKQIYI